MSRYIVQYMSGIPRQPVPKPQNVSVERDGIKIFKQLIRWQDMTNVAVNNSVGGNGFSVGKAIAGDVLAGGIGALAGGMSGKQKFNTLVQITYKSGGTASDLVLMPKGNTRVQEKFINTLMDKYGKAPPSFKEERQAMHEQRKAAMEAKWAERREQLGLDKRKQKEVPQWIQESPLKLLGKLRKK